ncbi:DUF2851 family protein [Hufsiella ginkgonis]|uniref:DUF2851 family protein n=1 Tax=Hufsiella ginkgonis TaxID=2695274 RepID=A0A7K1XWN9_9SPHI|nr:DUF2851 family protein [Hufsiella ginkgonis]MXV15380.1 DUF2851 family protein [Hufsiella ginkgonis]
MLFTEELLQFTWQFGLFRLGGLTTSAGEAIELISPGTINQDAGPDFDNARVRIGGTLWAGNIELHLRSSDWERHDHTSDKRYGNVILHVVYEHDRKVFREDGTEIPVLELKERITERVISGYRQLMENMNWIPCQKHISSVAEPYISGWLSRMLVERLEQRAMLIDTLLQEYKGSWEDAFYVMLARNFGFKTNAVPFELLARSLPLKLLSRHQGNAIQIESLVFGQAGFLGEKFTEAYPAALVSEYAYLRRKYRLRPIDVYVWKFSRLRPQNFPTLRLAQFAALVQESQHLFSGLVKALNSNTIEKRFLNLEVNPYWATHYHFKNEAAPFSPLMGRESAHVLLINTVAPFLFTYGKLVGGKEFINKAISMLEDLPPETNQVIRRFTKEGVICTSAGTSQALLYLQKMYCERKKCLNCGIGVKLLKTGLNDTAHLNIF